MSLPRELYSLKAGVGTHRHFLLWPQSCWHFSHMKSEIWIRKFKVYSIVSFMCFWIGNSGVILFHSLSQLVFDCFKEQQSIILKISIMFYMWKNHLSVLELNARFKRAFLIACCPSVRLSVNSSFLEPLGQFQPKVQSMRGWMGFKFVQITDQSPFKGDIITKQEKHIYEI